MTDAPTASGQLLNYFAPWTIHQLELPTHTSPSGRQVMSARLTPESEPQDFVLLGTFRAHESVPDLVEETGRPGTGKVQCGKAMMTEYIPEFMPTSAFEPGARYLVRRQWVCDMILAGYSPDDIFVPQRMVYDRTRRNKCVGFLEVLSGVRFAEALASRIANRFFRGALQTARQEGYWAGEQAGSEMRSAIELRRFEEVFGCVLLDAASSPS